MRRQLGFTLLELMIVVAVIAILAIIALPSYSEYIRKGKRSEAMATIGDIEMREERYRADYPTYANTTAATAAAGNLFGSTSAVTTFNSKKLYYSVAVSGNSGTAYTITATRKGDLANDPKCANFTLAYSGGVATKGMSDNQNVDYCWRQK